MTVPSQPEAGSPAAPYRRRGHLVLSLLAVLSFVGLAPLATVAWKLIQINREALTTSQQEFQLLLANSMGHDLDVQVEGLRGQLVRAARGLGATLQSRPGVGEEELRRELGELADERVPYLRFTYFQQQGVRTISVGELPGALEPAFANGLREAAEVLALDEASGSVAGRALLSDPILLDAEPPVVILIASAPVVFRGAFRGVLSGMIDLQSVWEHVARRNRTGHLVFAMDAGGNVFASSDPGRLRPGRDVRDSPLVKRFLSAEGRASETMPFEVEGEHGRARLLGSFERTRQHWGIFVQARQEEVYDPVRRMIQSTLTWAIAALALAGLAALLFARGLSGPINKLAAASRAFARGDFSTRVAVRSNNEIGELAETFNGMAGAIEGYIRRLKWAVRENNELFLGTIRAMAQAIDAKDPYTRGHSIRVNRYSVILARELGLSDAEVRDIHVSSLLHDVGKIGIDDAILQKPGTLTDEEFEIMKTHTTLGAAIMSPIRQMKNIIPGLRHHHEQWCGRGYPDGLAGEAIPLMARIIAVADTFDAITTDRPYQRKMSFERAVNRLNEIQGERLDAHVVAAFNRAWRAGLIRPGAEDEAQEVPPVEVYGEPVGALG